jgi:hypothetical protein
MKPTNGLLFIITALVFLISFHTGLEARNWKAFPEMTREEIQNLFDQAQDRDVIQFHKGIYDFSTEAIHDKYDNTGCFVIEDKSITVIGLPGSIILGPDSIQGSSMNAEGLNCFYVLNLDGDKDVRFQGLTIKNFLRGVFSSYNLNRTMASLVNTRDITVHNCEFIDIHRDAIAVNSSTGSLIVSNNIISAGRGLVWNSWVHTVDVYDFWQPEDKKVFIKNNQGEADLFGFYIQKAASVEIGNNRIQNSYYGIVNQGCLNKSRVYENYLDNIIFGIALFGNISNGIEMTMSGGEIRNNTLTGIKRFGISFEGVLNKQGIIRGNSIELTPPSYWLYSSSAIILDSVDTSVSHNIIIGTGLVGIEILDISNDSSFNRVSKNILAGFEPTLTHYLAEEATHDNTVLGSNEPGVNYIDQGINNLFTGFISTAVDSLTRTVNRHTGNDIEYRIDL